jgi:excisionase family DNA binding protein
MPRQSTVDPLHLPTFLKADDIATAFGIDRKSVYRLAADGRLPAIRLGGALRFDPADVRAFIDAGRKGGAA